MNAFPEPKWFLDSQPREVQLEALRRSYYGFKTRGGKDEEAQPEWLRPTGPASGWGHYLEMRLGKTPTALNEFEMFMSDFGFENMIVFCPNTFKQGWVDEAAKSGSSVPFGLFETSRHKDAVNFTRQTNGRFGIAMNYESLQYEKAQQFLMDNVRPKTLLVADESIKIKNHASITTKVAISVSKNAGATRVLSGLPMTQGPQDLYPQFRFIRQQNGVNPFAFRNRFCKMGGFKNKKIVGVNEANTDELQRLIGMNTFVAKRKDWGDPTKPEYYVMNLALDPVQQKHYREIDKEFVTVLESGFEVTADQVITKLMKMQQISSGFVYTENGKAEEIMDPMKTPKILRLMEFIEDEVEGKIIVPYHYSKSGDNLLQALAQYNPAIIRSAGWMKTNGRNTDTEKTRFNNDPACRVMILQISAGKYGHDLSGIKGNRCGTMVFYENTYSLDDRGQIEMRNTTAFQDWTNVYLDFVASTVERRAVNAHIKKESLVEAVFGAYQDDKERIERT